MTSREGGIQWKAETAGLQRTSATMVFAELRSHDEEIPFFVDGGAGGVVLRPSRTRALCGYGIDGSTDYNKPNNCGTGTSDTSCVPGCGSPPEWCDPAQPYNSPSGVLCGFGWGENGVQPWRGSDLGGEGGMLEWFAREGATFPNSNQWAGYNEIIVANEDWISNLPDSVDAIFLIGGRDEGSDADRVREMHKRFLETYGLRWEDHPLLLFRPWNWDAPFSSMSP